MALTDTIQSLAESYSLVRQAKLGVFPAPTLTYPGGLVGGTLGGFIPQGAAPAASPPPVVEQPPPPAAQRDAPAYPAWLPWAVGGGVLVVLLLRR